MEGGREEGFVKFNKSCLYVCCKKENVKKTKKKLISTKKQQLSLLSVISHQFSW